MCASLRKLFPIIFGVVLSGCIHVGQTRHYKEEVKLSSGQVVVVDRKFEPHEFGGIGTSSGWEPTYESLEIVKPLGPDDPPKWESTIGLVPMIFDRDPDDGTWYLIATIYACDAWDKMGQPSKYPYAEFKAEGSHWARVEFSQKRVGLEFNVMTSVRFYGETSPVTLAYKNQRMSDLQIAPKYVRVVDDWVNNCSHQGRAPTP